MSIADRLKALRLQRGLSQYKLSQLSSVSQGVISGIESGNREPTIGVLLRLCTAMGISLSTFFENYPDEMIATVSFSNDFEEESFIREYRHLSASDKLLMQSLVASLRQKTSNQTLASLSDEPDDNKDHPETGLGVVEGLAAAGSPIFKPAEDEYVTIPSKYLDSERYFIVQAQGDSMEPRIENGDYIVVAKRVMPQNGEIALIGVNGIADNEYVIKKFYQRGKEIKLISINKVYDPMLYKPSDIITAEKVVDIIDHG